MKPKDQKSPPRNWMTCEQCRLPMSPGMYEWHRMHRHRVLRCRMCDAPVLLCGITFHPGPGHSDFCSKECKENAREKGICRSCLKDPDPTFLHQRCGPCRERCTSTWRAISKVNQELYAMRQARFLPNPYRRVD